MPRIPIITEPSVRDAPVGPSYQSTPDVTAGLRALTGGLDVATGVLDKVIERENHTVAFQAEANIKTEFAKYDAELRKASQGVNAKGYADKVNQWWQEQSQKAGANLTPAQRELVGRSLAASRTQAFQGAIAHQNTELERAESDAFNASQLAEIQRAAASGNPAVAMTSSQLLRDRNAQRGAAKGWSPEQIAEANTRATTALHANVIQQIQQKDPTAALAYFNANKGEIDGTRHAELERALTTASAANDGDQAATKLWATLGPKSYNDPVLLDKMDEQARALFPNDPVRRKAAVDALRERAAAHNAAQAENNAAATNSVMAVYNQTKSLAAMKRSPAWSALPAAKQAEIENHVNGLQTTEINRQFALEGRDLQRLQRQQAELQVKGYAGFERYNDPTVLGTMSRAQVEALLPSLGNQLTAQLLNRFDTLNKSPAALADAKIDHDDMLTVLDQYGFKPYEKAKNEEGKARIGEIQSRLERALTAAQQEQKRVLTREEKLGVINAELAQAVRKPTWFGLSSESVPEVAISTKDVPDSEKQKITDSLLRRFNETNSPMYAPTPENIRRVYLMQLRKPDVKQ